MNKIPLVLLLGLSALALRAADAPRPITLGLVAKSQSNAVFQVARVGAEAAARDLSAKYKLNIRIDWRTPNDEDAQKQADAIEQLVLAGAAGISVSCSDANKLTDAINSAVDNGVPVATFDSDAPASKRFVTYGVDDFSCGEQVMEELAKAMGGKGVVAILAGNPERPEPAAPRPGRPRGREEIPRDHHSRHLLPQGDGPGRRRPGGAGDGSLPRHHRLGHGRRLAALH